MNFIALLNYFRDVFKVFVFKISVVISIRMIRMDALKNMTKIVS